MDRPIVNIDELEVEPRAVPATGAAADKFEAMFARIGLKVGARQLGYNITVVPPGKRAFPFHSHRVNEEMFFVMQGSGEIRIGAKTYPVRAGDFVACVAGGPETAHQMINSGTEELRYLAVSTQRAPEIWEYPDSGKFGCIADFPAPGTSAAPFFGRMNQAVSYWDGE